MKKLNKISYILLFILLLVPLVYSKSLCEEQDGEVYQITCPRGYEALFGPSGPYGNICCKEKEPWSCESYKKEYTLKYVSDRFKGEIYAILSNGSYELNKVCYDFNTIQDIIDNNKKENIEEGFYWFYTDEYINSWSPNDEIELDYEGALYLFYCNEMGCRNLYTDGNSCRTNLDCEIKNKYYPNSYGKICNKEHLPYECVFGDVEDGKPEETTVKKNDCNGCIIQKKCYLFGTQLKVNELPYYCSIDTKLHVLKKENSICQNNYECESNFCSNQKCSDVSKDVKETKTIIGKILNWLKNLL